MVSVLALLAGPSALVLLSAPPRLAPTRVRSALLCDTSSVRQAVPQCNHGSSSRRAALSRSAAAGASAVAAAIAPGAAQAAITKDSEWPLWLALPVAPYSRRKTIRREVGPGAGGHVERGMGQCAQRHEPMPLGPRCMSQYMPRQRQIKLRAAPSHLGQFAHVFRDVAAAARRRSSAICHSGVWCFDQLIGIYYVHVPIRMTVLRLEAGGLFVYAPVAP